jgi:hypothetical protein
MFCVDVWKEEACCGKEKGRRDGLVEDVMIDNRIQFRKRGIVLVALLLTKLAHGLANLAVDMLGD